MLVVKGLVHGYRYCWRAFQACIALVTNRQFHGPLMEGLLIQL